MWSWNVVNLWSLERKDMSHSFWFTRIFNFEIFTQKSGWWSEKHSLLRTSKIGFFKLRKIKWSIHEGDLSLNLIGFDYISSNTLAVIRGGSRIFSRGGGFSKNFPKFWRPFFFRSTKLIFRALPKHCFAPTLAKFSAPQANFWKNSQKSRFWAIFEKCWQKNRVFLARAPPQS